MSPLSHQSAATPSPLEDFVRDYVDVVGGVWDAVEPQVYDLLLPSNDTDGKPKTSSTEIIRVAFDAEAVSEHPGSQLACFGTPLVNQLLASASRRGRVGRAYLNGLNLTAHDFCNQLPRALTIKNPLELSIDRVRAHWFPQAVFWFQATFVSDQHEHQIMRVAIDLHYARQVRHLDKLVDNADLADEPSLLLPAAPSINLTQAYPLARDRVIRTMTPLAGVRRRELDERVGRQVERMKSYYSNMRNELDEQSSSDDDRQHDTASIAARHDALDREQRLRIAELEQKSNLQIKLRLINLLIVHQPKLLASGTLTGPEELECALDLVWDPLTNSLEAAACPTCGRPTFTIRCDEDFRPSCEGCPPFAEEGAA